MKNTILTLIISSTLSQASTVYAIVTDASGNIYSGFQHEVYPSWTGNGGAGTGNLPALQLDQVTDYNGDGTITTNYGTYDSGTVANSVLNNTQPLITSTTSSGTNGLNLNGVGSALFTSTDPTFAEISWKVTQGTGTLDLFFTSVSGDSRSFIQAHTGFHANGDVQQFEFSIRYSGAATILGTTMPGIYGSSAGSLGNAAFQLYDENGAIKDFSTTLPTPWQGTGESYSWDAASESVTTAVTGGNPQFGIASYGDGDTSDDFSSGFTATFTAAAGENLDGAEFRFSTAAVTTPTSPTINVPEPSTLFLSGLSALALLTHRRRETEES